MRVNAAKVTQKALTAKARRNQEAKHSIFPSKVLERRGVACIACSFAWNQDTSKFFLSLKTLQDNLSHHLRMVAICRNKSIRETS